MILRFSNPHNLNPVCSYLVQELFRQTWFKGLVWTNHTRHSRWWRPFPLFFLLLLVSLHLHLLGSPRQRGGSGGAWLSAHVFKRTTLLAALAPGLFGWGGRERDTLGFARSNKLHQSRIWEAEIIVSHTEVSTKIEEVSECTSRDTNSTKLLSMTAHYFI